MLRTRVHKFGGTALGDGRAVRRACDLVRATAQDSALDPARSEDVLRPILVVSAHEGVTGLLEALAARAVGERPGELWDRLRVRHRSLLSELGLDSELLDRHLWELRGLLEHVHQKGALEASERDHVLSFGERMSARVVAATLRSMGTLATPLDAFDLGFVLGKKGPGTIPAQAILEAPGIPVVTGFLALDERGLLTTLGPNGSDLSASLVAEALGAEALVLWKTVPGLMSADPHLVRGAQTLASLGWTTAERLSIEGAGVLHPSTVEPARRAGIAIELKDARHPEAPGTRVFGEDEAEGPVALTHRAVGGGVRVSVVGAGVDQDRALCARLLEELDRMGASPHTVARRPSALRFGVGSEEVSGVLEGLHAGLFSACGKK